MEDPYGMADFSHYMNARPIFQSMPLAVPDLLPGHRSLTPSESYSEMVLVSRQVTEMVPGGRFHPEFRLHAATAPTTCGQSSGGCFGVLEMEGGGLVGDGGTGRWPRQETLTLLEIRSRLDSKFKEANQKGPLWDEVSRIMFEEHGYHRTGKKCREKFENLYKYYKKTKDGRAGRQDGRNYRFFRQLEALCGESRSAASFPGAPLVETSYNTYNAAFAANNVSTLASNQDALQPSKLSDSISISNSSDFYSLSSENSDLNINVDNDSCEKGKTRKSKKKWKAKIKDFIDSQMRNIMEKQDDWLEKMTRMIEEKEQERSLREEVWRKQQEARIEREQNFWATERNWMEARDASFMEAMRNLTGKELQPYRASRDLITGDNLPRIREDFKFVSSMHVTHAAEPSARVKESISTGNTWPECEVTSLIQLRTSMEPRFQEMGCPEEVLWEEIAAKMACMGYDRNASVCNDKWESVSHYFMNGKEYSRACCYIRNESINSRMGGGIYFCSGNAQGITGTGSHAQSDHDRVSPPDHHHIGSMIRDGCYGYRLG